MIEGAIPLWLATVDSLRFVDANPAAESLFGYSREELLTMSLSDIVVDEERERLRRDTTERQEWGDFGTWTCVTKQGVRFEMTLRFHRVVRESEMVNFTFPTAVVGHPDFADAHCARIGPKSVRAASTTSSSAA